MLSSIPVNLIRQWCYCPRVVYYQELLNIRVEYPAWVSQGERFHRQETKLWQRRNLSRFNLQSGKKHHNLFLRDSELRLHGISDMAIEAENVVYAIEFKLSANNKKRGDILQLVAYAMLLEKHFSKPSPVGFLVGKNRTLFNVDIDQENRREVKNVVTKIDEMLHTGIKPESSASHVQCCACEYVNFCNDRL